MSPVQQSAVQAQQQLVAALRDPLCFPCPANAVKLVETHISWVFLAGRYVFKIKKAIDLGFLDFTDLEARRFYCEEEVRLNRRLAPKLYCDVVAIGGNFAQPSFGAQPAIEYAVKMRRFAAARLMDDMLAQGLVSARHIDHLAATLVQFHASLPSAPPGSAFGMLETILAPTKQNIDQLLPLLNTEDADLVRRLGKACEAEYRACIALFKQRKTDGWVRECHGDLHAGNIVLLGDELVPFDGIEFNANFRWIDVMNEVAFLVMDLMYFERQDLAFRFLNAYLEMTGDYRGVDVLRFYIAYRAIVRAKVNALRARQQAMQPRAAQSAMETCRAYLKVAEAMLAHPKPALIITYGLPGSGKSSLAQIALESIPAIRIRSDVERKRLFGLSSLQDSRAIVGGGIYTHEATQRTYAHLLKHARHLLRAGFSVIVDAAFLQYSERLQFQELAEELGLAFVILHVHVEDSILRQRILKRQEANNDASEAGLEVLDMLQASALPLLRQELKHTVNYSNEGNIYVVDKQLALKNSLSKMISKLQREANPATEICALCRDTQSAMALSRY